jgi:hypothetical protein
MERPIDQGTLGLTLEDLAKSKIRLEYSKNAEKRKKLGHRLCRIIEAGNRGKGRLPARWERNMKLYRNQTIRPDDYPYPGAPNVHAPLVQPKINILVSSVSQAILAQRPFFSVTDYSDTAESHSEVERVLQFFLEKSNFAHAMRQAAVIAAICGVSIIRAGYEMAYRDFLPYIRHQDGSIVDDQDVTAFLVFDAIHPANFTIYPHTVQNVSEAKLCGHRFTRRRQEIKELIDIGEYMELDEEDVRNLAASTDHEFSSIDEAKASSPDSVGDEMIDPDDVIELWQVIFKEDLDGDGREEYYLATVAPDTDTLLDISEYSLPEPWYFACRFHTEFGSFWPDGSIGHSLQGLQIEYNELHNVFILGSYNAALPPGFGSVPGAASKMNYSPGTVYQTLAGDGVQFANVPFDGRAVLEMIRQIEVLADRITRVSDMAVPRQVPGDKTATQSMIENQQLAAGIMEYLGIFSTGLEAAARFSLVLLGLYMPSWAPIYGSKLVVNPDELAEQFASISAVNLSGKTSTASPAARVAALNSIIQVAVATPAGQSIKWGEVARTLVLNSGLPNAGSLVLSEDEEAMMEQQQTLMQQQMIDMEMAQKEAEIDKIRADAEKSRLAGTVSAQ